MIVRLARFTFGFVSAFQLLACGGRPSNNDFEGRSASLRGEINHDVVDSLIDKGPISELRVSSIGGNGEAALHLANAMLENGTTLTIDGVCSSSCAEFLLPAAARVVARGKPLLAVHGNPLLLQALYERNHHHEDPTCFRDSFSLREIYRVRGLSTELALAQEQKLVLSRFETSFAEPCVLFRWSFRHSNWFPTSEQYARMMGIVFEGELCADDIRCIESRIRYDEGPNTCVVGEQVLHCR